MFDRGTLLRVRSGVCVAVVVAASSYAGTAALPGAFAGAGGRQSTSTVAFGIAIPHKAPQKPAFSTGRVRPDFISAATESLTILVDGKSGVNVNVTPGSPGCHSNANGLVCRVALQVVPATHTFTVKTYDLPGSMGNLLSLNSTGPIVVKAVGTTYVPLTLEGIVQNVILSALIPYPDSGFAATIPLTAVAQDADHNIIIGAAPFYNPVRLSTSDPRNALPSKTTLASPADELGLTVAYSGAQSAAMTISASAAGLTGTVVPAVITPTPATTSKLYVVEAYTGVKVFRTKNLTLAPSQISIPYPGYPTGAAVDASGHRLYVPHFSSYVAPILPEGDVGVYDTSNLGFVTNVSFGFEAGWLGVAAFDPANATLYVGTLQFGDNVTLIYPVDTAHGYRTENSILNPFVTIQGLAVNAAAGALYVSVGYFSPAVIVYSTAPGNARIDSISLPDYPEGVAVDAKAGKIYVAQELGASLPAGVVRVYGTAPGHPLLGTITGLVSPGAVAVDPVAGKLYVADRSAGEGNVEVKVFGTTSGYPLLTTIGNLSGVNGLAVTP